MNRRIADIEFLRGVAVLAVIAHHANGNLLTVMPTVFSGFFSVFGGWFGVDLFFVISGFVIARDLLPRLQRCEKLAQAVPVILAFWLRRVWRLWPSAWVWLALTLLACASFNDSGVFGTLRANGQATLAGVLQFANWRFAEVFMRNEYGASFPYWSLSLEEQFYLVLPLLAIFTRRYLLGFLLILVVMQVFSPRSVWLMAFRTDALALGVCLALWERQPGFACWRPRFLASRPVAVLSLLTVLALMGWLASAQAQFVTLRVGLIAMLAALLVWVAAHDGHYFSGQGAARRVMAWVGGRSYALYLIHIPAFFFTRELLYRWPAVAGGADYAPIVHILVAGALLATLSEINFRLIETPLRRRGAQIAARWSPGVSAPGVPPADGERRCLPC